MAKKVSIRNLYKVFGVNPQRALDLLSQGYTKDDILKETGLTVGVQDVSFDVDAGEIFVVMGLSGSGKSTLVRMINRLINPTLGKILIDGEDVVAADSAQLRRLRLEKVSMVFQHFALFPHKTVVQNVEYGLKVRGVSPDERRERALKALDQVGLRAWADRPPAALSGGMQQRVGLARGLAVDPEILLMDEPFSALDPLIRRDMQQELVQLQRELKKTIIFITHDLHEALILGDHIAVMKEGRFVQLGTGEEIVGKPADDYVAAFTQDVDRSRVFTVDSVLAAPHALDLASDTPKTALERMDKLKRNALHVLDEERVAGLVTYRDLAGNARRNGGDLEAVLIRDFPMAEKGARLHTLYKLCTEGLPIAVMDGKRLSGVAEPQAILAKLAAAEGEKTHRPRRQEGAARTASAG